jgi:hypothetical protein
MDMPTLLYWYVLEVKGRKKTGIMEMAETCFFRAVAGAEYLVINVMKILKKNWK